MQRTLNLKQGVVKCNLSIWGFSRNEFERSLKKDIWAVLDHGQYIMGPEIKQLEKQLAQFAGSSMLFHAPRGPMPCCSP